MKRAVWLWELFGFATVALGGTLLHFLYDWFGKAIWIAPFSGVNESTWEHMKLLFWPMLAFAVIQSLFFRDYDAFWSVKLRGMLLGLILRPLIFYTYIGVIGKSPDFINIAIFFVSAAIAYVYEVKELNLNRNLSPSVSVSIGILILIALSFIIFTFNTPELEIFRDPVTGAYGI